MRSIILLVFIAAIAGCKPADLPGIGDPNDKLKFVEGNWQLDKVVQYDLNAVKYNFPYKQVDVTSVAPFTQFKLSFTLSNGGPGNFTTTPGSSPKIIPLSDGNWKVDDVKIPQKINLIKGTDTVKMMFGSYNTLQQGTLLLQRVKNIDGKDVLRYDYYFKKI